MERSREEMARIHKERCRELKLVRAKMAEELGVDLHQRECTYEGYCSGTCPKCAAEERALNEAILRRQTEETAHENEAAWRRQMEETAQYESEAARRRQMEDVQSDSKAVQINRKRSGSAGGVARSRVLAAGLAAIVSLGLSGCVDGTEGATQLEGDIEQIDGGMEYVTEQTENVYENMDLGTEVVLPESESESEEAVTESETVVFELEGDVAPMDEAGE